MLFYIALFAGAMTIGSCSQDEMLTAIEEKPDVTQPLYVKKYLIIINYYLYNNDIKCFLIFKTNKSIYL